MAEKTTLHIGQQIERWTVVGECVTDDQGKRWWPCRCTCGTMRNVQERSLKSGGSKSCGCLRRERTRLTLARDLQGKTFGELTVIAPAEHQRKNGGIWWTCRCACGNLYDLPGTLLVTGRRTHCGGRAHKKNYAVSNITGQRFHHLTALYPLEQRGHRGSVIWHCRCDCGNEIDVSYNNLAYGNMRSCGCQKKQHSQELHNYLTHVAGTSIDGLKSKKLPADNTTGYKGVYFIKGKYVAKIVFQKKAYYLGTYDNIQDAASARKEAEELLFDGVTAYYEKWQAKADTDADWAKENPIHIAVDKDALGRLTVVCLPVL